MAYNHSKVLTFFSRSNKKWVHIFILWYGQYVKFVVNIPYTYVNQYKYGTYIKAFIYRYGLNEPVNKSLEPIYPTNTRIITDI